MPTVLVNYGGRKKAITDKAVDLLTLTTRFFAVFEVDSEGAKVSFQRYNTDWDEEIELDAGDEIVDKDRLTAIVTRTAPITPGPVCLAEYDADSNKVSLALQACLFKCVVDLQLVGSTPNHHSKVLNRRLSDSGDEVKVVKRPRFSSSEETLATTTVKQELLKRFTKTEDDCVPLPDPFPLPKNYRSDVASGLESRALNMEGKKNFFSAIAASMFTYKNYPTRYDYQNVATAIVNKYPFLKVEDGGSSIVSYTFFTFHSLLRLYTCRMPYLKPSEIDLRSTAAHEGELVLSLWHQQISSLNQHQHQQRNRVTHLASQVCSLLQWYLQGKTSTHFRGIANLCNVNVRKRNQTWRLSVVWLQCLLLCAGMTYTAMSTVWIFFLLSIPS